MQAAFFKAKHLFLFAVFALLVYNAAGGFAGRLAGGLALAAAAVLGALAEVPGLQSDDSIHNMISYPGCPGMPGAMFDTEKYSMAAVECQEGRRFPAVDGVFPAETDGKGRFSRVLMTKTECLTCENFTCTNHWDMLK